MHSIVDLLECAEAIGVLYELGYEPREDSFVELSAGQYQSLRAQGEDTRERWYRVTRGIFEDRNNPPPKLPIVSQEQKDRLLRAVGIIYAMSADAGAEVTTFSQRLEWLRGRLPAVFTGGG